MSLALFDEVLDALPDMAVLFDREGVIQRANARWLETLAQSDKALRGHSFADFLHPDDKSFVLADLDALQAAPGGRTQTVGCRWRDAHGKWRDLTFRMRRTPGGSLFLAMAREEGPERTLALRTEELEAVSGVGSWEVSPDDGRLYWSAQICRIHEVPPGFQPDLDAALTYFAPEAQHKVAAAFSRLWRDGTPCDFEVPFITATGRGLWVRATGAAEFRQGRMVRAYGTLQDVTGHRLRETHLRDARAAAVAARQQLETAVESLPDGFVLFDREDRLVIANSRFREIYAESAPVLIPGTSFSDILAYGLSHWQYRDAIGREADWHADQMTRHLNPGAMIEHRLANGRVLRVYDRRTPDGGSVGLRVDVTELYDARERAEEANRAKARFLANMSHELRTPLNGILGTADILAAEVTDPARLAHLRTIRDSGEALLLVLNDLLDMARIDEGRLTLFTAPFVPADVVQRVLPGHSMRAREKGLSLDVSIGPGAEKARIGDAQRIAQILQNLLSNAVKFTETGGVRLSLQADGPLVLTVTDSGIGISAEEQARILGGFEQADSGITRRYGGMGLGLSILHHLTVQMGGHVGIESVKGQGTTVTVTLPLPLAPEVPPMADAAAPTPLSVLAGKRVLVAEDNPVNLQILETYLRRFGLEVVAAENGREAVDLYKTGRFDLLCFDIAMPELDGMGALAEIDVLARAAGQTRPPAVAVTAHAMPHQVEEYLAAGFDAHLAKPVRRDLTGRTLAALVAKAEAK